MSHKIFLNLSLIGLTRLLPPPPSFPPPLCLSRFFSVIPASPPSFPPLLRHSRGSGNPGHQNNQPAGSGCPIPKVETSTLQGRQVGNDGKRVGPNFNKKTLIQIEPARKI